MIDSDIANKFASLGIHQKKIGRILNIIVLAVFHNYQMKTVMEIRNGLVLNVIY